MWSNALIQQTLTEAILGKENRLQSISIQEGS